MRAEFAGRGFSTSAGTLFCHLSDFTLVKFDAVRGSQIGRTSCTSTKAQLGRSGTWKVGQLKHGGAKALTLPLNHEN